MMAGGYNLSATHTDTHIMASYNMNLLFIDVFPIIEIMLFQDDR